LLDVPRGLITPSHLTNLRTDALHPFLRRSSPNMGPPRLRRIAATKRVPQKVELLFRQTADPRLLFVHRELQLRHHAPHRYQGFVRLAATADHHIIGIIHDERLQTLLVLQLFPTEHEPAHVQITQQWTDDCLNAKGNLSRTGPSVAVEVHQADGALHWGRA